MRPLIRDYNLPQWLRRIAFGVCSAAVLALLGLNWWDQPSGSWGHIVSLGLLILSIPVGITLAWVAGRFDSITALVSFPFLRQPESFDDDEPVLALAPAVTAEELATKVRTIIEEPMIEITPMNPKYGSWILQVTKGNLDMEYVWGPSRFGGRDLARPITPDDTPFDFADECFQSVDEALEYLRKLARQYA